MDETRTTTRFAWVPRRLDDGTWVHLAWYVAVERFEETFSGWTAGEWITVERRRA